MKKVLLVVAVVGFIGMTSCKKCEDCSFIGEPAEELCGDELDAAKAIGATCS